MRSFDTWNRYEDNQGNPLHGCVQFMVKDGTTVAPIFDSDGTALDNPQLTDIYGRTQHQVFIDEDCVAYFYKYIGNGIWSTQEGIDTSDQTKWSLQYTIENQNTMSRTVDSTGTYCVPSINDLRYLDVDEVPEINGVKVITLLGYNEIGDKEPINYYWNPESTEADDEGSIIKYEYEITGRWIMVQPTHHCDSRHFGIFPNNSSNTDDQTYRISKLFEYCNSKGINPYFDTNGDYVWYKYTNLNVSSNNPIMVSKGVQFNDINDSTISGDWIGDPHFANGNTNVVAKDVKTSWDAKSYTGYENVIIDKLSTQRNFQDAYIDARLVPTYGYNFNHCVFKENRSLGSNIGTEYNTFFDCTLTSKMFIVTGNNATSFATGQASNCEARQEDWIENEDAFHYYVQLRMTNIADANFDYKGRTSSENPIVDYGGSIISSDVIRLNNFNYVGDNCVIDTCNAGILEINNCTGKYNLSNWASGSTIIIKNCHDLVITEVSNGISLRVDSSDIVLKSTTSKISIYLKDSTISGDNTVYNFDNFNSTNGVVSISVKAANSVVKDSQINGNYIMVSQPGTSRAVTYNGNTVLVSHFIHGYFDNNVFNGMFGINGNSASEDYGASHVLVDGLIFQNNRSNLSSLDAWSISRLGCMNSDKLNTYTFVNNTGGFECYTETSSTPIITGSTLLTTDYNGMLTETYDNVIQSYRWSQNVSDDPDNPSYEDNNEAYFTKMRLFMIGTTDAVANIEITILPNPGPGGSWLDQGKPYYINPNSTYVAGGTTSYNFTCSLYISSTILASLTTDSKYISGTIDNTHRFVLPDIAKDPYSNTEEWQIRNFILGLSPAWNGITNPTISLKFRQADKRN